MLTAQYNAGILKSRILLLLSYSIPEREGGGGAPLVSVSGACVCCPREREPETDPQVAL